MNKLFNFIKTKFLTKSFITFCIIGAMNTLINFVVMNLIVWLFDLLVGYDVSTTENFIYYLSMALSTLIAFVSASMFSYFANARFTYKQKERDKQTSLESIIAFVLRYLVTYLFTLLIWWLMTIIFKLDKDPNGTLRTIANLIASVMMIPPFYLVLGFIFKRTNNRIANKNENTMNSNE